MMVRLVVIDDNGEANERVCVCAIARLQFQLMSQTAVATTYEHTESTLETVR